MALDWNKEISFGELFKKRGKKATSSGYPTKTTMNLYQVAGKETELTKVIPVAILLALGVGAFAKFAVFDQLALVTAKEAELGQANRDLAVVEEALGGYDELMDEYASFAPLLSASGVDASEVLTMVETYVMPRATVAQAQLEGTTLTLELAAVPLNTAGEIVNVLQEQAIVKSVAMTSVETNRTDATEKAVLSVSLIGSSAVPEGDDTFFGIDPNASAEAWAGAVGELSKK